MAAPKNIVLITGGNAGIGIEVARQLLADPSKHVIIGSRSVSKGSTALEQLRALGLPGSVEMVELDVTSNDSISAAAQKVEANHGRLDVLVNNAGVALYPDGTPLSEHMAGCFAANAIGPALMGQAFAPLLKKCTTTPRIVNVSSGVGSITKRLDPASATYKQPAIPYRTSKAALNMVTACQAVEFGSLGMKVFAVCPGFTVSSLSNFNNEANGAKPVSEGAKPIVDLVNGKMDAEHGKFLHSDGEYPW